MTQPGHAGGSSRERILRAAAQMTTADGWGSVTMARIASEVGVSRQTVYNEVGSKSGLAEAMVLSELERFLTQVTEGFDAHPDDLFGGIEAAVRSVLELARDNRLLHAVVRATHGSDTELLPLLTTHAGALLQVAQTTVTQRLGHYRTDLTPAELGVAIDLIVRAVLSHVMAPGGDPATVAGGLIAFLRRAFDAPQA